MTRFHQEATRNDFEIAQAHGLDGFAMNLRHGFSQGVAMTCNLAQPYDKTLDRPGAPRVPVFSRIRADLIFKQGDAIEIFAFPRYRPMRCTWQLSRNRIRKPFLSGAGEVGLDHSVRLPIPSESLTPGFYDIVFTSYATASDHESSSTTFGYQIDELPLTESRPADFEPFWRKALAKLAAVPLKASVTHVRDFDDAEVSRYNIENASLPEALDPEGTRCKHVRLFKAQFDSAGGKRIHAWLAIPDGKGPFPAILILPGGGCNKVPAPVEHARHGYLALMLQVHGMDVDQDRYETPADYMLCKGGAPEDEYYHHVCLAGAQAVNYLMTRPDVDLQRIAVAGGSQGGMLAIVTAALCPTVKAVVSVLCYYADWPTRNQIEALNLQGLDGCGAVPSFDPSNPLERSISYYDAMNFAPQVRAATLMAGCLCDIPSPPSTVHAVYRRLGTAAKELHWSPGTNHELMLAFEHLAWRWLDRQLGLPAPR